MELRLRPMLALAFLTVAACGGHAGSGPGPTPDASMTDARAADARVADAPIVFDAAVADAPVVFDAPVAIDAPVPPIDASSPPPDAPVSDAAPPPPPPDAPAPPDARPIDAAGPQPDAACTLATTLTAQSPYIIHQAGSTTTVTSVVSGAGPFTCAFYIGPGAGFRPGNVALNTQTCTLTGGADGDDPPGQYGFIVRVFSATGCSVDIPVAFDNGTCGPLVPVDPPVWPPRVPAAPLAGYAWHTPIELTIEPTEGGGCRYCNNTLIISNVPISLHLECPSPGVVCSDCNNCIEPLQACNQGSLTMSRDVTIKPHSPIRSDGRPAWVPVTLQLLYTCTPDIWACNMESLEL